MPHRVALWSREAYPTGGHRLSGPPRRRLTDVAVNFCHKQNDRADPVLNRVVIWVFLYNTVSDRPGAHWLAM